MTKNENSHIKYNETWIVNKAKKKTLCTLNGICNIVKRVLQWTLNTEHLTLSMVWHGIWSTSHMNRGRGSTFWSCELSDRILFRILSTQHLNNFRWLYVVSNVTIMYTSKCMNLPYFFCVLVTYLVTEPHHIQPI